MSSGGSELPASNGPIGTMNVYGQKKKKKVTFNLQGQIIEGKNEFKARGLELLKSNVGLAYDDWRHVPATKKQDMFDILSSTQKRKPDRVELYVDARKHPKTKLCHPGAIFDVGLDPSFNRESGGSHSRPNGEAGGIQPTLHGSEKSATGSPSTLTSGPSKCYKLLNLDGSKPIAQVVMMKTTPGSLVHGRPMLSFEVKVNVIKVFPGMGDEPIWKGNQGGVDTLAESEGGFLVWPKYLMEEVLGENRVLAGSTTLSMVSMKHVTNLVEEVFDAVAVATGHSQPRLLAIKGMDMWSGRQMHSHFYKVPEPFRNECYGSVAENTQLWCVLEDLLLTALCVVLEDCS
ncbi:hypothetical protein LguiA_026192 [Lonicera macranthoides]